MADTGIFIRGLFISSADKWDKDGKKTGNSVLLAAGVNSYKVTVRAGLPSDLTFGGLVTLSVRPFVYNGGVYYTGEFVSNDAFPGV